ncbi:hypothetical protein QF048_000889 [Streptomyces sp. W4I9-2]|nr:hypothetical protein [Streptomyces sp. W4I9-2]
MPADARGDDVYQPQDDDDGDPPSDELGLENTLGERDLDDQMEEGYSPPERPLAMNKFGSGAEVHDGKSLDQRLAQEHRRPLRRRRRTLWRGLSASPGQDGSARQTTRPPSRYLVSPLGVTRSGAGCPATA